MKPNYQINNIHCIICLYKKTTHNTLFWEIQQYGLHPARITKGIIGKNGKTKRCFPLFFVNYNTNAFNKIKSKINSGFFIPEIKDYSLLEVELIDNQKVNNYTLIKDQLFERLRMLICNTGLGHLCGTYNQINFLVIDYDIAENTIREHLHDFSYLDNIKISNVSIFNTIEIERTGVNPGEDYPMVYQFKYDQNQNIESFLTNIGKLLLPSHKNGDGVIWQIYLDLDIKVHLGIYEQDKKRTLLTSFSPEKMNDLNLIPSSRIVFKYMNITNPQELMNRLNNPLPLPKW